MMFKKTFIKEIMDYEICHFFEDNNIKIYSKKNQIFILKKNSHKSIRLPLKVWKSFFIHNRMLRRLFRLDKMNVSVINEDLYLILYQGCVYTYDYSTDYLELKFYLKNCRNVLHNSIMVNENGCIMIGEYGSNKNYQKVPIHVSYDYGKNWNIKYIFKEREIRHIHGIFFDKYDHCIWICTGDFNEESMIVKSDFYFKEIKVVGRNSQNFRTCKIFFTKKSVYWSMDSQYEKSYALEYNRKNKKIIKHFSFPGPVIYSKFFDDGKYIISTSQEIGPSVEDDKVHLYISDNFIKWKKIYEFTHDGYNKNFFKFGLVCFAEGKQLSNNFPVFCEAINKYDGKVLNCCI